MVALDKWHRKLKGKELFFTDDLSHVAESCERALGEVKAAAAKVRRQVAEEEARLAAAVAGLRQAREATLSRRLEGCQALAGRIQAVRRRLGQAVDRADGRRIQDLSREISEFLTTNEALYRDTVTVQREGKVSFRQDAAAAAAWAAGGRLGEAAWEQAAYATLRFADQAVPVADRAVTTTTLKVGSLFYQSRSIKI